MASKVELATKIQILQYGKLYDIEAVFSGDIGRLGLISYFLKSPHCQAFSLLGAVAFEHLVHGFVIIPLYLEIGYL